MVIENGTSNHANGHETNGFQNDLEVEGDVHARLQRNMRRLEKMDWTGLESYTSKESFEDCSLITSCLTYLGFYILMILGFINQLFFTPKVATEYDREGYPRLYNAFDQFYSRYVYRRVRDCWNRPICSSPGAYLTLKDRITPDYGWTFQYTGTETRCINLGSYNYLGFAETEGACADESEKVIRTMGLTLASPRQELGTTYLHNKLEALTAQFFNVEDALVVGMGFATNALGLPAVLGPGCLAISDERNHASLILGLRLSHATVTIFRHNDMQHLEEVVRQSIVSGQGKPGERWQPWRKIFIVVEGVYSMEGSVVHLPQVVAIKQKYNCYVYLDEAHSVGAMGPHGRGVTDYYGVDPKQIDILMGTFTKSFGSAGGYIAGSKLLINYIRKHGHAGIYAYSMSPPVAQQIISSMSTIMGLQGGDEGAKRIKSLARNTKYFRKRLHQMGCIVYGHEDSPVVPMLVYLYSKIGCVVRDLSKAGVAVVGVGFPATPLMMGRIRFCLSAAHTKEQLDYCLDAINNVSQRIGLDYSHKRQDPNPIEY